MFLINYCDQSADKSKAERFIANLKTQVWNWKAFIKPLGWFAYDIIKSGWKFSKVNNGKGSTFKLINEINESNSKLGSKSDYETKDLEERYEAQIQAPIKTGDCIIM